MKYKKILITTVAVSLFNVAPLTQALTLGQAGDIANGLPYEISKTDFASYYKNGTMGNVTFSCYLDGDNVVALVYPGKNFQENIPAILKGGDIGMYEWTLKDKGEENGNIRVRLVKGSKAIVRCQEMS